MKLTLATCFVPIADPEASLTFYRDHLGLDVRNDVARGEYRWISVGSSDQPDVTLVLTNYLAGAPEDADALGALMAKGALNGVHFYADDLTATFNQLRDAGVDVVQEPTDQPWGVRDGAVRDPSGNLVRVEERPAP